MIYIGRWTLILRGRAIMTLLRVCGTYLVNEEIGLPEPGVNYSIHDQNC